MSLAVSPSPRLSSGSLLLIEVRTNPASGSQTSATVTVATMSTSLWSGGQSVIVLSVTLIAGGRVSWTLTPAVQVEKLPLSSRAVKVTVVLPSGRNAGASWVIAGVASQMSVADTPAKNAASCGSTAWMPQFPVHSTVMLAGQVITGGVVSSTVIETASAAT